MVPVEVTVIAESMYTIFVTIGPDRKASIPKEYCATSDGKYPKNFILNSTTTLMVKKWYCRFIGADA
jgi:hypothetical protein